MADSLREMVEREMRAELDPDFILPVDRAVDVAVRLVRKWGHGPNCRCHAKYTLQDDDGRCSTSCRNTARHPYVDAGCAPPDGGDG